MDNQELKRLLAANLRGHYRWLVICYQHKLYNFVRYMLHDPEEAKDLVQDIFIKAFEALSSFSQPQWEALELQPWLFTIARNHCLNYITRVEPKRSKLVSLDQSQGKY